MRIHVAKDSSKKRTAADPRLGAGLPIPEKQPFVSQPVSPCDDVQARIAKRAYEIHAQRGYRYGYALEDWLEAEREVLGEECMA